jgi:hypothetical protein
VNNLPSSPVMLHGMLTKSHWDNCITKAVFTETRQQLQESSTPTVLEPTKVDGLLKENDCAIRNSAISCERLLMSSSVSQSSATNGCWTELEVECSAASRASKLSTLSVPSSSDNKSRSSNCMYHQFNAPHLPVGSPYRHLRLSRLVLIRTVAL